MHNRLLTYIAENKLIIDSDKTLLTVSGGKDSVAMVYLFNMLDFPFAIAHCNFNLRGEESNQDETFVKQLALKMGVDFFTKRFDVKKYASETNFSIQMAARDLRYKWFHELSQQNNFSKIATAHHQDDVVETLLIKKSRKSSLGALQGIPLKRGNIIRPMLCFNAQEITQYLNNHQIKYRKDSSNGSLKYQRNKIRHTVIPKLETEKLLKEVEKNKIEYQKRLKLVQKYINSCSVLDDGSRVFPKLPLQKEPQWQEILYECLKYYGPFHWKDVFSLMNAEVGKKVSNTDYQLVKERDGLHLFNIVPRDHLNELIFEHTSELTSPLCLSFTTINYQDCELELDSSINTLNFDKLKFPLLIRKWQEGDSFIPLGMRGRKKVSDFLTDEKLTTKQKENTFVLCSSNDIVCIVGRRINEHYKLVPQTEKVYIVKPLNNNDEQ